jgi:hypothetical protein
VTGEEATTLFQLRCVWDQSFRIECGDGVWSARALADPAKVLTAGSGTELRELMQGIALSNDEPARRAARNEPRPTPDRLSSLLPVTQREVLRQALADAVYYRDPPLECQACGMRDGLCDQCAAALARARAYLDLGRALGIEVPA